jgi:hypothetical protein
VIGTVFRSALTAPKWLLVEGDKGKKMKAKMEAEALFPYL